MEQTPEFKVRIHYRRDGLRSSKIETFESVVKTAKTSQEAYETVRASLKAKHKKCTITSSATSKV